MMLDGPLGEIFYDEVREHRGHHVVVSCYGSDDDPVNVAIECLSCSTVLLDADRPIRVANDTVEHWMEQTRYSPDHPSPVSIKCVRCNAQTTTGLCASCAQELSERG